ncbi:hypothetical protein [Bradyrhizobium sp. UNPA324]|uniref:hypothetical protein n=1 Tax=Bradyrhizobium sp. UNPA324 TaxID=1141174 RepID=UPI0015EF88FA|nr:hypothetical protein [Bradyrhizobium sp. UNPA324]
MSVIEQDFTEPVRLDPVNVRREIERVNRRDLPLHCGDQVALQMSMPSAHF